MLDYGEGEVVVKEWARSLSACAVEVGCMWEAEGRKRRRRSMIASVYWVRSEKQQ
jgi:hypothetical protein